jgi:cytochrome b pre-mRNA-processing protein 3
MLINNFFRFNCTLFKVNNTLRSISTKKNIFLSKTNFSHSSLRYLSEKENVSNNSVNFELPQQHQQANKQHYMVPVAPSFFQKVKESMGFQGSLKYPQPVLLYASYRLYLSIQYQVDYDKFFKLCNAPDVMYSFCLINFLHVWLVSVPLMQLGSTGLFVRKNLYKNMWKDIETRDRKLNRPMNKKNKLITYNHLNDIFRAFLFGFDEGILSDDTVLAGAVWRHILEMNEIQDYAVLGILCDYIRKNVAHLDKINEIDYLKHGIVSFIDLDQKELDHLKVRQRLIEQILQRESGQ